MTRVNIVPVKTLADQHLFAEWREIKMVPAALRRSLRTRHLAHIMKEISKSYTLNTGHVKFFFDKMKFLSSRYDKLTQELLLRKFNLSDKRTFNEYIEDLPSECIQKEWSPTHAEKAINTERIMLRLKQKEGWYRYYGKIITSSEIEDLLNYVEET